MSKTNAVAVNRSMCNRLNISRYPLFLMGILLIGQLVFGRFAGFAGALGRTTGMSAAICLVFGVILILGAALKFRKQKTTVDPTKAPNKLVTSGLFRWSRNPMYVGMLLILLVQPLLTLRPHLFVFALAFFIIMNFWVIPREETVVKNIFGQQYEAYCAKTKRWANLQLILVLLVLGSAVPLLLSLSNV